MLFELRVTCNQEGFVVSRGATNPGVSVRFTITGNPCSSMETTVLLFPMTERGVVAIPQSRKERYSKHARGLLTQTDEGEAVSIVVGDALPEFRPRIAGASDGEEHWLFPASCAA